MNRDSDDLAGYVTSFSIDDDYISHFDNHVVSNRMHDDFWVPAKQLYEGNKQIEGFIQVIAAYFGLEFVDEIPDDTNLKGKTQLRSFDI